MKKLFLLLSVLIMSGCATNVVVKDNFTCTSEMPFMVGQITNQSGINPEGDKDAVTLMKEAMVAELAKSSLPQGDKGYSIDVTILRYEPGDAFKRWLMPGWGATVLDVAVAVKDPANNKVGEMSISRNIAAGGGYTIGAWKYVFTEVAKAIIEELTKRRRG